MASYDYRCRTCDRAFTVQRPMTAVETSVCCPQGHDDVARVWSAVSIAGRSPAPAPSARPAGGGCGCGNCSCG